MLRRRSTRRPGWPRVAGRSEASPSEFQIQTRAPELQVARGDGAGAYREGEVSWLDADIEPNYPDGDKRGQWSTDDLWIRVYEPDKNTDPAGGMAPPKITYQLPDGRRYYLQADQTGVQNAQNATRALFNEAPNDKADPGSVGTSR